MLIVGNVSLQDGFMTKKEVYRLRDILHEMKYVKEADTDETATHDRFIEVYEEGIKICDRTINMLEPLKYDTA